jgi:N-acetylmuramoyl-L-alanine amidase
MRRVKHARTNNDRMPARALARKLTAGLLAAVLLLTLFLPLQIGAATLPDARTYADRGARTVEVTVGTTPMPANSCFLYRSVTYVPLLAFCERMGDGAATTYRWRAAADTAEIRQGARTVAARTGEAYITVNDRYFYGVTPNLNWNGVLYVPIRAAAKAYGADVSWNAQTYGVHVSDRNVIPQSGASFYDADELYWLSRIISAESKGESLEGRIAVGNVILNRVASRSYPNSIYGVIFDRKYGVQFTPAANGTVYQTPTAGAVVAAKVCLEGYPLSDEILYFCNPAISTSTWLIRTRPVVFTIGNHVFFK